MYLRKEAGAPEDLPLLAKCLRCARTGEPIGHWD